MSPTDLSTTEPSITELGRRLERSFVLTTNALRQLLQGMQQRRTTWISARPSNLQPAPELEQLAKQLAELESERTGLVEQITTLLPLPPHVSRDELSVNVTRIAAALPAAQGRSLRRAADEATLAAKTVRVEVSLGERLLRFTQRAHDSLLGQIAAKVGERTSAPTYDRFARFGGGLVPAGASGKLIDGRA